MPGELRDELAASVEELSAGADAGGAGSGAASAPAEAPAPATARDDSGRFAPRVAATDTVSTNQEPGKEAAPAVAAPATADGQQTTQTAAGTPAAAPAGPGYRAPVSWRPEEREHWATMNPTAQAAVSRREREISETLRTTHEARQFHGDMMQALTPYMPMIQAEQSDPVRAVKAVMQTAAVLRTAPPMERAAAVADMVYQFGIDIQALDNALHARSQGRRAPADPFAPVLQSIEQQLQPVRQFMQTFEQRQQQALQAQQSEITQTLEQFVNDPVNEFAPDVTEEMADVLDAAARRGVQMSLQDAYKRATLLHPTISQVVQARQGGQGLAQQTAAAQNARNAAASVGGAGAPSASSDDEVIGDDIRSAMTASIRQLGARR